MLHYHGFVMVINSPVFLKEKNHPFNAGKFGGIILS